LRDIDVCSGLNSAADLCEGEWLISRLTIRRVFAAILGAAVALTPASRLTMAAAPSDAPAMMHDMAMPMPGHGPDSVMVMSDDDAAEMPCCPHDAPMPADCDKCAFMAACMAQCFSGLAMTAGYPPPFRSAVAVAQPDEVRLASLGRPPPEHPPRSLV
jgi:hypothetical protein